MLRLFNCLVLKDLRRHLRQPGAVLMQLAIPLFMSAIFGLVFQPSGKSAQLRFTLLVADLDDSFASRFVKSAFSQDELGKTVSVQETTLDEANYLMKKGKASALLVIPKGFGDKLVKGEAVALQVVKNPAETILPGIAVDIVKSLALMVDYGSRLLHGPLGSIQALQGTDRFPSETEWTGVSMGMRSVMEKVQHYVMPPVIGVTAKDFADPQKEKESQINFFALFFPGMAIMGMLFIAGQGLRDLAEETSSGRLRRIFAAPVGAGTVLGAKVANTFALTLLSFGAMSLVASLLFGMRSARPDLYFLVGVLTSAACTGIMALVYCLFPGGGRSEAMASVVVVVMCMLGGNFFPVDSLPEGFAYLARATANFWSADAFRTATGGGLEARFPIGLDLAVLAAYAALTLFGGVAALRRRVMRGVAQ